MKVRLLSIALLSHAAHAFVSGLAEDISGIGDRLDVLQREVNRLRVLSEHKHTHRNDGTEEAKVQAIISPSTKQIEEIPMSDAHESTAPAPYFTFATETTILFKGFKTDTWESYSFALVVTLFLAMVLEYLRGHCQISAFRPHQRESGDSTGMLLCSLFLRFIAAAFQYSLILLITTYDAGIFLVACAGTSFGFLFYNWLAMKETKENLLVDYAKELEAGKSINNDAYAGGHNDIEQGSAQSVGSLGAFTFSRLDTISEDDRSRASLASTEDGRSIYSAKTSGTKSSAKTNSSVENSRTESSVNTSGTKSLNEPAAVDTFEDEPRKSIQVPKSVISRDSNGSVPKLSTNADDMSVVSSVSRKGKVTITIKDTNDLRAKLACLQTVQGDAKRQNEGDSNSVGCMSVPVAMRNDDDGSTSYNSVSSMPVAQQAGVARPSRGFSRGRRPRNVTLEI